MPETIAAQATPPGQGGIGIIRISGPSALKIAEKITQHKNLPPRNAVFTRFYDESGKILDEGLLLYFSAPNSFTGDDVIELQLHGSPVIIDLLLQTCVHHGARLARPGEFSERAFHNGKIDLAQAEAIADLIESGTETAARMATRSLQGVFSEYIHELVEQLIHLRMYVEAAIDFPEEEIDFLSDGKVQNDLLRIINKLDEVMAKAKQGSLIKEGMMLVIAGQPNAGKSSLMNALAGNELAIVTNVPGTTRDVLREKIQIDGMPVHLIDTAGIRESDNEVEIEGIRRAQQQLQQADHILWVYDAVNDPDHLSFANANLPENVAVTFLRNKIDKLNEIPSSNENEKQISLSAKTGDGMELLRDHLKNVMGYRGEESGEFLARRRHIEVLKRAKKSLDQADRALNESQAGEILAEELRLTQNALNEITGEFTSDDLLGKIFSSFCIGK
jgi:tRNA modification GTPase